MAVEGHLHRTLYEPLNSDANQIRLVRLEASTDFAAKIQCELFHSDLSNPPEYEALSYVWGDPDDRLGITVNETDLQVTRNLEVALHYLRLPDRPRILWVDAICINQNDDLERSSQVRMMRKIYVAVTQVVVWLGESTSDSTLRILDLFENNDTPEVFIISPPEFKEECSKVFRRTWWTRLWVLQEVAHNRPVTMHWPIPS